MNDEEHFEELRKNEIKRLTDSLGSEEPVKGILTDDEILKYAGDSIEASRIRLKRGENNFQDKMKIHGDTLTIMWILGLAPIGMMLAIFAFLGDNLIGKILFFSLIFFLVGYTAYYLKRFEADPVIKHIWKTGEDVEDETLVSSSDIWDNTTGLNAVESFTEIILKISRKDVKEWFTHLQQEDRTRVNTIALFTGRFVKDENDPTDYGEYQDVRLFSKLNIPVEYLSLSKDLNFIYRVYGA